MLRNLTTSMAAALLFGSSLAGPAQAFTFLGIKFGEEADDTQVEIIDPLPYQITFDVAGSDRGLRSALQSSSSLWSKRDQPASGSAGLISAGQDDYRTLLGTLYQRGYYAAAISVRINGREAADLPLTRDLQQPAQVAVSVDPGPQFRFGDVGFVNGAPAGYGPPRGNVAMAQDIFLPGETARADLIAQAGEEEVVKWRYAGHPKAQVAEREVIADHRTNELDVTIRMDPGPKASFGPIAVTGNTGGVNHDFIRYMADIHEGAVFTEEVIEQATDRLMGLRAFRAVRIVEAETVSPDGTLPITIETTPQRPRRFGIGATLSSTEGIGIEGFWLHRQLFQRAERLRFDLSISGIGEEADVEDYDYVFSTYFTKPGFLDPDNSLVTGFTLQHLVFEDYTENSGEIELGIERRFNERLSGAVYGEISYSEVEDDHGTDEYLTFSLPVTAQYDVRDVPLNATEGFYLSGEIQPFFEAEFGTAATRAVVEGRTYFEVAEDSTVLAFRARAGTIFGGDLDEMPPGELFFAGGGGSIRGYGYRSIGIEVGGDTLGARSILELSAEVRQHLFGAFELAGFVDGGIVSTNTVPGIDGDLHLGAGAGVRYDTALGPIRFDVAVPIDPRPGDPDFALYIGIGQAF